jgi:hypothetical protein
MIEVISAHLNSDFTDHITGIDKHTRVCTLKVVTHDSRSLRHP